MKTVVCSIRDIKAETYAQPWFVVSEAVAVRSFTDLVNNQERGGTMFTHPEDYQLFAIGEYNDNTGEIVAINPPKHLVSANSVKRETPNGSITKF